MSSFDPRYRAADATASLTVTLYRIGQAVSLLLRDKGQAHGLSSTQVQALLFLAYARPAARTIGGLAARLGCTPATASGVADVLERKGLAERVPWPQNRRIVTLNLTCDGTAMAARVDDSLDELETILRQLPLEEQAALLRAAGSIARGLAQRGWLKLYGMCWQCSRFRPDAHADDPAGQHHCGLMDVPVSESDSYTECPEIVPLKEAVQ